MENNDNVLTALVMGQKMFTIDIPYSNAESGILPNKNDPGTFYCALRSSAVDILDCANTILLRNALEEILSIQEHKKFLLGFAERATDALGDNVVLCYFAEAKEQDGNYFHVH